MTGFLTLFEQIAPILCAVEIAKTNAVFVNRQKCSRFYLGDSHVVSLLGMTLRAIDFTEMPFEQWCAVEKQKTSLALGNTQDLRVAVASVMNNIPLAPKVHPPSR